MFILLNSLNYKQIMIASSVIALKILIGMWIKYCQQDYECRAYERKCKQINYTQLQYCFH